MATAQLQHLAPADVRISLEQAQRVLRFFFPDQPIEAAVMTSEDIPFAQALLIEAIDASAEMSYVQVLYDKAFMKLPTDYSVIKDVAKSLCRQAAKNWFRHATGDDLRNPEIYEGVRSQLARNFRSVWMIRMQTGDLTY
jgi:hypothetical protein